MQNVTPRYCSNCGKELASAVKFCAYCAAPLQHVWQPEPIRTHQQLAQVPVQPSRRVGILLGIGILFIPYIFAWLTLRSGYRTKARAISLGWMAFVILFIIIPSEIRDSRRLSNVNAANTTIATTNSTNSSVTLQPAQANANTIGLSTPVKQSPCDSIESELASVESDQARVEEMLDATEDFGPQAGSPKRAIYMNALKRKGELQLQHIALERKLKTCGKKR
jgi:hypothetical protein